MEIRSKNLIARSTDCISDSASTAKILGHNFNVARSCHPNDSTTVPNRMKGSKQQQDEHSRKKPRRRTIWIPSDDTTIMTIHPGVQSDARSLNDFTLKLVNQSDMGGRRQEHPLAAAPKRAPLQPMLKSRQKNEGQQDLAESGCGKENPPQLTATILHNKIHGCFTHRARGVSTLRGTVSFAANDPDALPFSDMSLASREQSKSSAKVGFSNDEPKKAAQPFGKPVIVKQQRKSIRKKKNTLYYGTTWNTSVEPYTSSRVSQLPSTSVTPVLRNVASSTERNYPILHEDVERPELFENAWLNDQEASLAQCINGLFEKTTNRHYARGLGHRHLRQTLLSLHQGAEFSLLERRLKASLLYGCLSRPKDSSDASSLKSDIGRRGRFISLWATNYSLNILSAAAEVVVGREAPVDSPSSRSEHCKKDLAYFLDSCLLRNEDDSDAEQSSPAWCWRRTMLRSLMLIYLLDKAKQLRIVSTNLYQASSTIKSSLAFLKELTVLIDPSAGDIYRLLRPLGYHVSHIQYPLSEYSYNIENLATDFRDGVRLTRLIELLLYPLCSRTTLNENITMVMPTSEPLTTVHEEKQPWILSRYLKYPCAARAQRIHNVQVALGALRLTHGVGQIAEGLGAEEIVDGHREKTMTLLWALVGSWRLDALVNFGELRKEIRRLRIVSGSVSEDESDAEEHYGGMTEGSRLLRAWSGSIARRNGLRVPNLTTSFADVRIFNKIVEEYLPYLSEAVSIAVSGKPCQLDARLRAIGCSTSFASLFVRHERGQTFHQNFTVASLAFLASRLLGASKRGRAAAVIQRTYRRNRNRKTVRQRCRLLQLAHDCKATVESKKRVWKAARILQRAWRAHVKWLGEQRVGSTKPQPWAMDTNPTEGTETRVDIWLL